MAQPWGVSIDIGSTNTAGAYWDADSAEVRPLRLSQHAQTMPSLVVCTNTGQWLCGAAAVAAQFDPTATVVTSPKLLLDTAHLRRDPTGYPPHSAGEPGLGLQRFQPDAALSPATIAKKATAALLRHILHIAAQAHGGIAPSVLILTHPMSWPDELINDYVHIAASVTSALVVPVAEPIAAAYHYQTTQVAAAPRRCAVVDIGGGTLDVAVIDRDPQSGVMTVIATGGEAIGGRRIDQQVFTWLESTLLRQGHPTADLGRTPSPAQHEGVVAQSDTAAHNSADSLALWAAITTAKEVLSDAAQAHIAVPGDQPRTVQLTRDEFSALITPTVQRMVELTGQVLQDANDLRPVDPAGETDFQLFLTGGVSRIPAVQRQLASIAPIATLDDPKTVVARGALPYVLEQVLPQQLATSDHAVDSALAQVVTRWHAATSPANTTVAATSASTPAAAATAALAPHGFSVRRRPRMLRRRRLVGYLGGIALLCGAGLLAWGIAAEKPPISTTANNDWRKSATQEAQPTGDPSPDYRSVAQLRAVFPPAFAQRLQDCAPVANTDNYATAVMLHCDYHTIDDQLIAVEIIGDAATRNRIASSTRAIRGGLGTHASPLPDLGRDIRVLGVEGDIIESLPLGIMVDMDRPQPLAVMEDIAAMLTADTASSSLSPEHH
ncbi:Hsp70 family protein [Corynebacterium choanae]|uniref:Chaperone protein DnaK n=1 Tax=Corynebacterium choanae TaxID=1862358 RepID=A0A3G6JAV7_9CORY|nr:Hsp70 family protein [Corynebacterium choanae]AZA13104.1 Chaperone protein DnaK [Corynebacterium choanae]